MKKLLMKIAISVSVLGVLTGCVAKQNDGGNGSEKVLVFTYGYKYDHSKDEYGNEIAVGLWDGYFIDRKNILERPEQKLPKFFISGDIVTIKIKGDYHIDEDARLVLDEKATVSDVTFDLADVTKIKATDIVKDGTGDNAACTYDSLPIIDTNVIASRDCNFVPLAENIHADLYISSNQQEGDPVHAYGLYSFDPQEVNNIEPTRIRICAFGRWSVCDEERILTTKQYDSDLIGFMVNSYYYGKINPHTFTGEDFVLTPEDPEAFQISLLDERYKMGWTVNFLAIPLKTGTFKIHVTALNEFNWILNVHVSKNNVEYDDGDIDLGKYTELRDYMDGITYHEFTDPYPGLDRYSQNIYTNYFQTYNADDYKDYLMDDCYYPSYFPFAPKSPIMSRHIKIMGEKDADLTPGCEKSSIYDMTVSVSRVDPGCTHPEDRVAGAFYEMFKLSDVFKIPSWSNDELLRLKYEAVEPIIYKTNGLTFYLLKIKRDDDFDELYSFFKDDKYLHCFNIFYDMSKE